MSNRFLADDYIKLSCDYISKNYMDELLSNDVSAIIKDLFCNKTNQDNFINYVFHNEYVDQFDILFFMEYFLLLVFSDNISDFKFSWFNDTTSSDYIYIPSSIRFDFNNLFEMNENNFTNCKDISLNAVQYISKIKISSDVEKINMNNDRYLLYESSLEFADLSQAINLKYIDFRNNSNLKEVILPSNSNTFDNIPFYTFMGCTNLKKINIPRSVTTISIGAFYYCTNLSEINYEGTKKEFRKIEGLKRYEYWAKNSGIKRIICTDGIIQF